MRHQRPQQDARIAFFEQAGQYTRYLEVETRDGRYLVTTRSQKLGRHLFTKQGRPEFGVLRRAVSAIEILIQEGSLVGRLFVDVGANIGTSTISALLSHGFGSAVCIEPEEENFRLLRANLVLNDLDDVQAVRVAASDRVGNAYLLVFGGPPGKTQVAFDLQHVEDVQAWRAQRAAESGRATTELPKMNVTDLELVTLDHLVASGVIDADRVGMLWIDVEGHEGHVLGGAGALTERGTPIVFEFDPTALEYRALGARSTR
jgi:FkbM family methyltransferase